MMTEYSVRFDEGLQKLADDDVPMPALNPLLNWWFLHMAGLNGDRKDRVVAALANDRYELDGVRHIWCRLLAEVHVGERSSDLGRAPFRAGDRARDRDFQRARPSGKGMGASSPPAQGHRRGVARHVAVV